MAASVVSDLGYAVHDLCATADKELLHRLADDVKQIVDIGRATFIGHLAIPRFVQSR
jgi:hypothetical protein